MSNTVTRVLATSAFIACLSIVVAVLLAAVEAFRKRPDGVHRWRAPVTFLVIAVAGWLVMGGTLLWSAYR